MLRSLQMCWLYIEMYVCEHTFKIYVFPNVAIKIWFKFFIKFVLPVTEYQSGNSWSSNVKRIHRYNKCMHTKFKFCKTLRFYLTYL